MASPDPWSVFLVMVDHGERLGIMDDYHIVVTKMVPYGVL